MGVGGRDARGAAQRKDREKGVSAPPSPSSLLAWHPPAGELDYAEVCILRMVMVLVGLTVATLVQVAVYPVKVSALAPIPSNSY